MRKNIRKLPKIPFSIDPLPANYHMPMLHASKESLARAHSDILGETGGTVKLETWRYRWTWRELRACFPVKTSGVPAPHQASQQLHQDTLPNLASAGPGKTLDFVFINSFAEMQTTFPEIQPV